MGRIGALSVASPGAKGASKPFGSLKAFNKESDKTKVEKKDAKTPQNQDAKTPQNQDAKTPQNQDAKTPQNQNTDTAPNTKDKQSPFQPKQSTFGAKKSDTGTESENKNDPSTESKRLPKLSANPVEPKPEVKKDITNENENEFIICYNNNEDKGLTLKNIIDDIVEFNEKCIKGQNIAIPTNSVIHNFEPQTIPSFVTESSDPNAQPFYFTTLKLGKILQKMNSFIESGTLKDNNMEAWEKCTIEDKELTTDYKKNMYNLLQAAIAIFMEKDVVSKYTAEVITFLYQSLLVQNMLCTSRIFTIVLEVYAKAFIKNAIVKKNIKKDMLNQSDKNNQFKYRIAFLNLIKTFSSLWLGNDFANFFFSNGEEFLHYSNDSIYPPLFNAIIDAFTSLCKSNELATKIIKCIKMMSSDIISFDNFYNAIVGHSDDLGSCEIDRKKLAEKDSSGLESILHLMAAISRNSCLSDALPEPNKGEDYKKHVNNLLTKMLQLTLSAVPATLKAACFDFIADLPEEFNKISWNELNACDILNKDYLDESKKIDKNKRGIISEIELIERPSLQYQLVRSFVRMLTNLLRNGAPKEGFAVYNDFLYRYVICHVGEWNFLFQSEKWGLIADVTQCWTNLILYQKEASIPLFNTVLRDQELIKSLIALVNNNRVPLETLLCVIRLFVLLCKEEDNRTLNLTSLVSVKEQIGWNAQFLHKVLLCISTDDRDIQILAIHLIAILCKASPNIVQIILSKASARAIEIFNYVINYTDDSESGDEMNVKCSVLYLLLSLGPESYFLRHVCGFDLHDPPLSIKNSTLTDGILITILEKLHLHDTHIYCPMFTSFALRLLLLISESELTIGPVLSLLLSSKHAFFIDQLLMLRDSRCQKSTIGCYLQLLAREATTNKDAIFSGSTRVAFDSLLTSSGGSENSRRNILILEFIDRIDASSDSIMIAKGVKEIAITFLHSIQEKEGIDLTHSVWSLGWCMFISTILEKITMLSDPTITNVLSQTAAVVAHNIFDKKIFGMIEDDTIIKVFGLSLQALINLFESTQKEARIGIYTVIQTIIQSLNEETRKDCASVFYHFETNVIESIIVDSNDEIPILEANALSVAEGLISIAKPEIFADFVRIAIRQLDGDWNIYTEDKISGSFIVKAKCSFFTRIISATKDSLLMRIFIEEGLCRRLSFIPFWREIPSAYSESPASDESELKLEMGSKVLKLLASLAVAHQQSNDIKRHITYFLEKVKTYCVDILKDGQTTLIGLHFLSDLVSLVSVVPDFEKMTSNGIVDRIPHVFDQFSSPDHAINILNEEITNAALLNLSNEKKTPELIKREANVIVNHLLRSCIYFLVKRSNYQLVFDPPLVGNIKKKANEKPALSVVTKYVTDILRKENVNDKQIKTFSSMCLIIIWKHIDTWSSENIDCDINIIRTQAKIFTENPFVRLNPKDFPVIKKLVAFASDK